ncbi:unnamed protein product [Rhizophagus irregularis]|nr:unnamed protein product [Rhizophagus irregularis]
MEKSSFPRSFSKFLEKTVDVSGSSSNEETASSGQQPTSSSSGASEHLQDPDFLSNYASLFNLRDLRSLRVTFRSATQASEVIPPHLNVNVPQESQDYILPNVNRTMLENLRLDINQLSTSETFTDTLVAHLIFRTVDFDQWPMTIELHPTLRFSVGSATLTAIPEFVISLQKNDKQYSVLIIEDKHLNNIHPSNEYGEPQIAAEIIACGDENIQYWQELTVGCPQRQSITIIRYPGDNSNPINGFDLSTPNGRQSVIDALCKLREFIIS